MRSTAASVHAPVTFSVTGAFSFAACLSGAVLEGVLFAFGSPPGIMVMQRSLAAFFAALLALFATTGLAQAVFGNA